MTPTLVKFVVAITIGGSPVTEIGPYYDGGTCQMMQELIYDDIVTSFKDHHPYGLSGDMWGIGDGAIYRLHDYGIECKKMK